MCKLHRHVRLILSVLVSRVVICVMNDMCLCNKVSANDCISVLSARHEYSWCSSHACYDRCMATFCTTARTSVSLWLREAQGMWSRPTSIMQP